MVMAGARMIVVRSRWSKTDMSRTGEVGLPRLRLAKGWYSYKSRRRVSGATMIIIFYRLGCLKTNLFGSQWLKRR